MEENGILDPLDKTHIYALHFVFNDRVNEKLQLKMACARHRFRIARSSPLRLFTAGSLYCSVDIPDADLNMYGVDGNIELHSAEMNDTRPALGALDFQLTDDCRQE
ncbi:hypothetical protein DPMN_005438 [Dreissena polymorpha]|uniref:Integrase core domain-containing protein n=1 Tax=Dreissena polymorpha TaxID=45954 RepID=A0A9D4MPM7_DREPO|nr:hypothetical protein DPMN_005438 [Dreissena polymorpha]